MGLFGKMKSKVKEVADVDIDFANGNYTWQQADALEYDDFEDDEKPGEKWISKRKNSTSGFSELHVIDLNTISDGYRRQMLAVYGVPVGWGSKDASVEEFESRFEELSEAEEEGGAAYKAALDKFGFLDEEHYEWIRERVQDSEAFQKKMQQSMMDDAMANVHAMRQEAAAADPGLLEPFEGLTVSQWAQAAVAIVNAGTDEGAVAKALAANSMDRAKWDRINAEFQSRMQRDTMGVIATEYGKAFSGAQGISGGYGLGKADGSADQLGEEPVSFDKYGEIAGAQAAWAEQGMDVNAKLQEVFGITAMDISKYGSYWSTRFTSDVSLVIKHGEDIEKYRQKYMGQGFDDDLDI